MRFSNWDILLFPEDSRIPIQEFEVKCQALPQSFDIPVSNRLLALAGTSYQNSVTHVPTLTCFISSLDQGRPFRVSIHSWEKPRPSELLQSFRPAPERIVFEAKLYVDGRLKAQRHLGVQNTWPEVIDTIASNDFTKPLRFPPFHAEILQQAHWDAGDSLGRIRIVIAEGISQPSGSADGRTFDKLREVVAFSFQHAPKHILEYSGIAWPNARMFSSAMRNARSNNFDAHAHSPRRSGSGPGSAQSERPPVQIMNISMPGSMAPHASKWAPATVKTGVMAEDPFVVVGPPQSLKVQSQRRTNVDVSMKDASMSSKNPSEMSGVEMEQSGLELHINRAGVDGIIDALTPAERISMFHNLSPPKQSVTRDIEGNAVISFSANKVQSKKAMGPSIRSQSVFERVTRRSSTESRRSISGQSGNMSWEETPTLGDLWSGTSNEYPGLLPSLQSSTSKYRSTSVRSKRKRSLSPRALLSAGSDLPSNTKGMSTSPCKAVSTPAKADEDDSTITVIIGDKAQTAAKQNM